MILQLEKPDKIGSAEVAAEIVPEYSTLPQEYFPIADLNTNDESDEPLTFAVYFSAVNLGCLAASSDFSPAMKKPTGSAAALEAAAPKRATVASMDPTSGTRRRSVERPALGRLIDITYSSLWLKRPSLDEWSPVLETGRTKPRREARSLALSTWQIDLKDLASP